jgi:hypothetical protein
MKNTKESINQQIQFIIKEIERNVVELVLSDENSRFYIYDNLEPALRGSNGATSFNMGKMLEITDFIEVPRNDVRSVAYKQAFQRFIEANEFLTVRFNEQWRWIASS